MKRHVIPLCRLSWLFANILVVGGEKSHCIVYEHLLIFYALLRDFYYALGDYFAHSPRVCGPSELTPRLFDPGPRFIESRRKYLDGLWIEGRLRPDEL
jgi:hypothetical protein